jgi:hypothetical protein
VPDMLVFHWGVGQDDHTTSCAILLPYPSSAKWLLFCTFIAPFSQQFLFDIVAACPTKKRTRSGSM